MHFNIVSSFILLPTLAILFYSQISQAQLCKVINGNELQFYKTTESFIINCFNSVFNRIKVIKIESCNLLTVDNILQVIWKFSFLETLSITGNPKLEKADFGSYSFYYLNNLNLADNNINTFDIRQNSQLISLNLSHNKLTFFRINMISIFYLTNLDLSYNSLSMLYIAASKLRVLNLSASFDVSKTTLVTLNIPNYLDIIDLSNNGLTNIDFVVPMVYKISLKNNSFTSLDYFNKIPTSLQILLADNPLQCNEELMISWLKLRMRNITFDSDTKCSFPLSTRKYSVNKYGSTFVNEKYIIDMERTSVLLQIYLGFNSMNIWIAASQDKLTLGWTRTNQLFEGLLKLISSQGDDLYTSNITLDERRTRLDIYYDGMCRVASVDILAWADNLTLKDNARISIPIYRQNITSNCPIEKQLKTATVALIAVAVFFALYIIVSLSVMSYLYCHKLRKSRSVKDTVICMEDYPSKQTTETFTQPKTNANRSSYVTSSHESINYRAKENNSYAYGSYNPYPIQENDFYMAMGSTQSYAMASDETIYDQVDNKAKQNLEPIMQIINNRNVEEIYD